MEATPYPYIPPELRDDEGNFDSEAHTVDELPGYPRPWCIWLQRLVQPLVDVTVVHLRGNVFTIWPEPETIQWDVVTAAAVYELR
jgi:hypothetical protein